MELTITNRPMACPLSEGGTHEVGGFLVTSSSWEVSFSIGFSRKCMAQWLSWLERRPVTAEVVGSSPIWVVSGVLAQLGEHLPYKQGVTGSSPVGPILQMPMWLNWQSS